MDGGSTDKTLDILKKYEKHLKWFSGRDKGQADAINKGLKLMKGDIVAYLNADDLYLSNTLHKVNDYFQKNQTISWVTGKCKIIDIDDREIRKWLTWWKNLWLYVRWPHLASLFILNFISQPATFWRKEVLKTVGYFNTSLRYTMDYDYWLRLSNVYKLGSTDNYLAGFRVHGESKGGKGYVRQFTEGFEVVKHYTNSPLILTLHRIHDILTINIYNKLHQ